MRVEVPDALTILGLSTALDGYSCTTHDHRRSLVVEILTVRPVFAQVRDFSFNFQNGYNRYYRHKRIACGSWNPCRQKVLQNYWDSKMLIKRFLASLAALVALLGVTATAQDAMAPVGTTFDAPYSDKGVGSGVNFVADQLMDYDLQVFAPADFSLLDEKPKPSTGVFATYDRTFNGISGPKSTFFQGQAAPDFNYTTWGNRFELGFMGENNKGWLATIQTMGGMTYSDGAGNTTNPMLIGTKFQSYELNRIFRQELKNGGYFEPYVGGRFVYLSDRSFQDTLFDRLVFDPADPTAPPEVVPTFDRFQQHVQNNAFGATMGARFFKQNGRFTWAGQTAVSAHYNRQYASSSNVFIDEELGSAVAAVDRGINGDAFMPLWEGRMDLSYEVTRDLSLRVGAQVLYMWDGMVRANMLPNGTIAANPNSIRANGFGPLNIDGRQDVLIYGLTFGCEWRR